MLSITRQRSDSLPQHIPKRKGFINDYVRLFSNKEINILDSLVHNYEKLTTVEIAVAIVNSTMVNNADFEEYTLAILRKWGIGKKGKNKGILIVISPDLRRMRIQNDYRIESILSDAETKAIIDNVFTPKFKKSNYFEGTRDGIIAIINRLKQNGL